MRYFPRFAKAKQDPKLPSTLCPPPIAAGSHNDHITTCDLLATHSLHICRKVKTYTFPILLLRRHAHLIERLRPLARRFRWRSRRLRGWLHRRHRIILLRWSRRRCFWFPRFRRWSRRTGSRRRRGVRVMRLLVEVRHRVVGLERGALRGVRVRGVGRWSLARRAVLLADPTVLVRG